MPVTQRGKWTAQKLWFLLNRIRERLWFRPLVMAVLSVAAVFTSKLTDASWLPDFAPDVTADAIGSLLTVMASSMLVIATFAVASMVSAYASASTSATPRAFRLVVADDASQNALSTFIGSFIFSIVALTAVKNEFFGIAARFTLLLMMLLVLIAVILTFVRWVDRIARLGRLETAISKVENATIGAIDRRRHDPHLSGIAPQPGEPGGHAVFSDQVGYVQQISIESLQACAERAHGRIVLNVLPGALVSPGRALAYVEAPEDTPEPFDDAELAGAFVIGDERLFDHDPRFGLVVLSEIAGRALSPGINDPGTAIVVLATLLRVFVRWRAPQDNPQQEAQDDEAQDGHRQRYDRVTVPALNVDDMFDDAFTAIARDGAGNVEVGMRLQKTLHALALLNDAPMRAAAMRHSRLAIERAERAMALPHDLGLVRAQAGFSLVPGASGAAAAETDGGAGAAGTPRTSVPAARR